MSDESTMFNVEPMSWEELATRLQTEKIEPHDEIERLRQTLSHLLLFARGNEHVLGIIHAALDSSARFGPSDAAG